MQKRPPARWSAVAAKRLGLVAVVSLSFLLGAFVAFSAAESPAAGGLGIGEVEQDAVAADAAAAPVMGAVVAAAPPAPEPPALDVIEGTIGQGATLYDSLRSHGISPGAVHVITREMAPHFDFRQARPGHSYRVTRAPSDEGCC